MTDDGFDALMAHAQGTGNEAANARRALLRMKLVPERAGRRFYALYHDWPGLETSPLEGAWASVAHQMFRTRNPLARNREPWHRAWDAFCALLLSTVPPPPDVRDAVEWTREHSIIWEATWAELGPRDIEELERRGHNPGLVRDYLIAMAPAHMSIDGAS